MLYQKILTDEMPYQLRFGALHRFEEHRHADIEFHYCVRGGFDIMIDRKRCRVEEGELALIGPRVSHEVPDEAEADQLVLTVIVGPTLLRRHFGRFAEASFLSPVCSLASPSENHRTLRAYLRECADLCRHPIANSDLMLTGDLYKICACLLNELSAPGEGAEREMRDLRRVANIEKALEMIHYDYAKPLTVENAAAATGYGKSNFCKIFKDVVGDSFHHVLNRRRVQNACVLLSESDLPVAAIAQEVGFGESKTFCRVFRSVMEMTPGTYRAQARR